MKILIEKAVIEQALEALEKTGIEGTWLLHDEAITALREALAEQAKQEPVAWALSHSMGLEFGSKYPIQETKEAAEQMARQHMGAVVVTPLYAAPVQQAEQEPVALLQLAEDALVYHTKQTRPIQNTIDALAAIQKFKEKQR